MDSKLTRSLLFSILATQLVGFGLIASLLSDRPAAPQPLAHIPVPASIATAGSGSATVAAGFPQTQVPQGGGAFEPAPLVSRDETGAGGSRAQTTVVETGPLASNPEALRQSSDVVDLALSAGVWTRQDSRTLRQHMLQLNTTDRIALLEKIHGAINRQQLKPEDLP